MTILGHVITWHPHAKGFAHSLGGSLLAMLAIRVHPDTIQLIIALASFGNAIAAIGYGVFGFAKFVMRWRDRRPPRQKTIVFVPDTVHWGPND